MAISIRESYPDIYHRRQTSEKTTNVYQMQLPWRPGWRTLVTGHGLGGNTLTATSYLDRLRKIVQLVRRPGILFINISTNIFEKFLSISFPIAVTLLYSSSGDCQFDQHGIFLCFIGRC